MKTRQNTLSSHHVIFSTNTLDMCITIWQHWLNKTKLVGIPSFHGESGRCNHYSLPPSALCHRTNPSVSDTGCLQDSCTGLHQIIDGNKSPIGLITGSRIVPQTGYHSATNILLKALHCGLLWPSVIIIVFSLIVKTSCRFPKSEFVMERLFNTLPLGLRISDSLVHFKRSLETLFFMFVLIHQIIINLGF